MNSHPPLPKEEQEKLDEAIRQVKSRLFGMLPSMKPEEQKHVLEKIEYLQRNSHG